MKLLSALILVALILPIHGQEKGPQPGSDAGQPKGIKKAAPKAQPSPAPNINVINQQTSQENKDRTKNHAEGYFDRLFAPENLPQIGLLIAGLVGIGVAIKTLRAIKLQATAMMDADCALCLILWDNFIHLDPEAPDGALSHCFKWSVSNSGKTPAFIRELASRFIVIDSLDDLPAEPSYPEPREMASISEPVISSGTYDRKIYSKLESNLPYQEIETKHRSQECILYAFGFVRYLDVYGREQETRFGVFYNSAPAPRIDIDRFYVGGPKAYNRYKQPKRHSY